MLLDTCALLWLVHDQKNLSDTTIRRFDEVPILYVSAITGFEIGIKYKKGKLQLPLPPKEWLEGALEHHGISIIGLDMMICLKATELPPVHRNPCDRFIIATAILKEIPVVTSDRRFAQSGVETLR